MNTKTKTTKKTTAKSKPAPAKGAPVAKKDTPATKDAISGKKDAQSRPKAPTKAKDAVHKEELVVFAFRLTLEERKAIHKAAGPGKASKFVRTLTTAAARGDEAAVKEILEAVGAPTE